MRGIVIAMAIAMTSILGAQSQTVVIYPKSGEPVKYRASEVDHIEFLPASEDDDTYQVEVTEYYCPKGESQIYGKLYRPEGVAGALPTVVCAHSASLTADAMNAYAHALAEAGYCAYAFDFCGGSEDSRSDGTVEEMTISSEEADLKAVIADLRQLESVDANQMFVLGSSQGGLVAALTAEDPTLGLKGLILFYPAFNIPDLIALMDQFGGFGGGFGGFGDMFGGGYSEAFCDEMRDFDVYANIGTFANPVKIIHGSNDMIVNVSYSEQAVEVYPNATLDIIQGANHGFNADNLGGYGGMGGASADYDSEVIPKLLEFVNSCITIAE
ncbi:MAG: alpha/beta hydrolase family protein [Lepagella sp.]